MRLKIISLPTRGVPLTGIDRADPFFQTLRHLPNASPTEYEPVFRVFPVVRIPTVLSVRLVRIAGFSSFSMLNNSGFSA